MWIAAGVSYMYSTSLCDCYSTSTLSEALISKCIGTSSYTHKRLSILLDVLP